MLRIKILITTITLFVITSICMASLDAYLQNEITPMGIISFEFVKTIEASNVALEAWGEIGRRAAGISLGLDFLYLIIYSTILFIFLQITSEKVSPINHKLAKAITYISYATPLTGIFDAIENIGLISLLLGSQNEIWPAIAYYFASAKFLVLSFCMLALLIGLVNFIQIKPKRN